ncbi:MAG TPA: hypothetical protein PKJ33_00665 [Alphaproteobacteria bacterium]|nr:hypothetical protein [Alphaproteobacteria bacterium]
MKIFPVNSLLFEILGWETLVQITPPPENKNHHFGGFIFRIIKFKKQILYIKSFYNIHKIISKN